MMTYNREKEGLTRQKENKSFDEHLDFIWDTRMEREKQKKM